MGVSRGGGENMGGKLGWAERQTDTDGGKGAKVSFDSLSFGFIFIFIILIFFFYHTGQAIELNTSGRGGGLAQEEAAFDVGGVINWRRC